MTPAPGYDSAAWRRTRRDFLAANPICTHPGCGALARQVHHIDGKGPLGPRGYDWSNLQALCASCHGRVSIASRPKRRRAPVRHPGLLPPEEWAA